MVTRRKDHEIRAVLHASPDGLTARQVRGKVVLLGRDGFNRAVARMGDVYIDRWVYVRPGVRPSAVYCAVAVPADCPKPDKKFPCKNVTLKRTW